MLGNCSPLRARWFGLVAAAVVLFLSAPPAVADEVTILDEFKAREAAPTLGIEPTIVKDGIEYAVLRSIVAGHPVYYILYNRQSADTISSDELWAGGDLGLNVNGNGVTVGVWDQEIVLSTHVELAGRVSVGDGTSSTGAHATHVAGTIAATGIEAAARGMANKAEIETYNWDADITEATTAAGNGMRVSNHSYGIAAGWAWIGGWAWFGDSSISTSEDWKFGFYLDECASWDNLMYNEPQYLAVFAAGNDRGEGPAGAPYPVDGYPYGYDTIGSPAVAKNGLTVGAVRGITGGYVTPSGVKMTDFSSYGPCDDGRIKPDVVAKGQSVWSTVDTSNTAYEFSDGTSMAAPAVAGSVAQLIEHYRNVNSITAPYVEDMRSSTVRALVIHTADDAGTNGPDYIFGWGLMNTETAAGLITADASMPKLIDERTLDQDDEHSYFLSKTSGEVMKVTIAWTDPAGSPPGTSLDPTTKMLVNDLDIRLYTADESTQYKPWVLNPATPSAQAYTGDNTTDNVEQIRVPAYVEGDFIVRITHKGTLSGGSQDYAFIASGVESVSDTLAPIVSSNDVVVPEGGEVSFTVRLPLEPDGNVTVTTARESGDSNITVTWGATLTFTTGNWSTPQTVTLAAPADADNCDTRATFSVTRSDSSDPQDVTTVNATAGDDDIGMNVTPTSITVDEGGAAVGVSVVLTAEPCEPVTIDVTQTNDDTDSEVLVDPNEPLPVFDSTNWDEPQMVYFLAEEDSGFESGTNEQFRIRLLAGTRPTATVTVAEVDNDQYALVTLPKQIYVPEGDEVSVVISLNHEPLTPPLAVNIDWLSGDADIAVTPDNLDMTDTNWFASQSLRFTAAEDTDRSDHTATFRVTFPAYPAMEQLIVVTEIDNDKLDIEVLDDTGTPIPTNAEGLIPLDIDEWGTAEIRVRLSGEPEGDLDVTATQLTGDPYIVLTDPTTLTFTTGDWSQPQAFTAEASSDFNDSSNKARIELSALTAEPVVVQLIEKDRVSYAQPEAPAQPSPTHGSLNVSLTPTLTWGNVLLANSFDVYVSRGMVPGPDDNVFAATGLTTPMVSIPAGVLNYNTAYRWRVFARNSNGISAGSIWTFTTLKAPTSEPDDPDPNDPNDGGTTDPNDPNDGGTTDPNDPDGTDGTDGDAAAGVICGAPFLLVLLFGLATEAVRRRARPTR